MYKLYPKEHKIPIPIALIAILLMLSGVNLILNKPKTTFVNASKLKLERLDIANITHNSISIIWRTKEKEISWLIFGEEKNNLNKQVFDDRDITNNRSPYLNHFVTLKNLQSNKRYYFEIAMQSGLVKQGNNLPFTFITKNQLPLVSSLSPAMGKIQDKNGRPLVGGAVFLKIGDAELLSDRTKEMGEWLIPLYYLTKINTSEFIKPKTDSPVVIEILGENSRRSIIKTTLNKVSPLPQTIIIGTDYNFTKQEVLSETTVVKDSTRFKKIDTIFPKDNAVIPGKRPIFKGIALPNKKVKIIVESNNPQTYDIYSDKDGVWTLIPFYDLEPGKHQLTVITDDENGKEVKIIRTFNILKSGEAVLGEATPSATIIPTEIPTNTPVPTNTPPVNTVTPTIILSVTQTVPSPGINSIPLTIFSTGLIILGVGLILIY